MRKNEGAETQCMMATGLDQGASARGTVAFIAKFIGISTRPEILLHGTHEMTKYQSKYHNAHIFKLFPSSH